MRILVTALALILSSSCIAQSNSIATTANAQTTDAPPLTKAEAKAQKAEQKKKAAEDEKAGINSRMDFAREWEKVWLRAGQDVDVKTSGPNGTYLAVYWMGVSKAFFFNFDESRQDVLNHIKQLGFKKFTISVPPSASACNVEDECRHTWTF